MNIAIIGTGNVGGTLGKRLSRNGHKVVFATREPQSDKTKNLLAEVPNAKAASTAEAASAGEIVLLATPFLAAQQALRDAGNLSGKIVIDATNPLLPTLEGLSVGCTDSAAEQVSKWASGAKVVKAFNTVGANVMANPDFGQRRVAMFYCGDDTESKKTVARLIAELGFEPLDAGPLKQARVLEPFAMLWISLALQYGYGTNMAFELLRR